jgi:hypothetical protein
MFQSNMSPPSSGLNSKSSKKPRQQAYSSILRMAAKRWALSELHNLTTWKTVLFILNYVARERTTKKTPPKIPLLLHGLPIVACLFVRCLATVV